MILSRVSNRDNSTHFFLREADVTDQYYTGRQELSNQDYLAFVLDYDKDTNICTITQRNYFEVGDKVEVITPNGETIELIVNELFNENMENIDKANHAEEIIKMVIDKEIPVNSMVRKAYDE